ncbi:MAG: acyl-CoA dehydrogenase family protein, partial [Verrucomicrobiota bacterium]
REWANERVQWGSPIGHHAAIAHKISMMASNVFAMEAMTLMTAALVDRKETDIRIEAAMCKMWCTEAAWRIVDETMAARGGRGYETADSSKARGEDPIAVERFMRDCRINMIFEGSSEIMRLFIAREALDPHLTIAGGVLNPRASMGQKASAGMKALGYYAKWYPGLLLPFGSAPSNMHSMLAGHAAFAAKTSRRLARTLFHAMGKYGPKLELQQLLVGRIVDIGTEIFAIACVCARAQSMFRAGEHPDQTLKLADYFCRESRLRIARHFNGIARNNDQSGYKIARNVLEGEYAWLEDGIV